MHQQMPMDLEGMLRMLAGMPREERQFRQTEMLDMFFSMPEDRAAMMMRPVIEAKLKLSEARQLALGETQTAVLADYPAHKRAFLLRAHKRASEGLPEVARMRDMQLTQAAAKRLDPERQQRIMQAMQDVMGSRA
ncbi:MAG: hypothetical protein M3R24_14840 [Chloroflexota bacterium]|nr:hypothetical protein [Chloroflexota bacterium]